MKNPTTEDFANLLEESFATRDLAEGTVLKGIIGFEGPAKVTPDGLCPHVWVEGLSITGDA